LIRFESEPSETIIILGHLGRDFQPLACLVIIWKGVGKSVITHLSILVNT